jgi:hypothetical protein
MKKCKRCSSDRIIEMLVYESPDNGDMSEYKGQRCDISGLLGEPEMVQMNFCVQCGQIQSRFPISEKRLLENCWEIEEEDTEDWSEESMSRREKELGIGEHGL